MNMLTQDKNDKISSHIQEKKNTIVSVLRASVMAALLMTPSLQMQSKSASFISQEQIGWLQQKKDTQSENAEFMVSYEAILKDGVKKALTGLNSVSQIPEGGKTIDYYRDDWILKWKKLTPESVKKLNLPDKFDISPRSVTSPVPSMVFHLKDRKFDISPDRCNIKNFYLTSEALVIETTLYFDITYDKDKKLPELFYKLWMLPAGKWEKEWFRGTTVTEI